MPLLFLAYERATIHGVKRTNKQSIQPLKRFIPCRFFEFEHFGRMIGGRGRGRLR